MITAAQTEEAPTSVTGSTPVLNPFDMVICSGKLPRIARIQDEELLDGDVVGNPESFIQQLKQRGLRADVFTFAQKVPDAAPKYGYAKTFDDAAVIPITTFSEWMEKRAHYDARKAVKKAKKLGVEVRVAEFDDRFVEGICQIYNENPLRRGAPFTHFGKEAERVKRENSTYFDRSIYIGAYFEGELIGFIRMVHVDNTATTLQVISLKKYSDKKPTNALIAKAVEVCAERGLSHFVYGSFIYNNTYSSLSEFKKRNGFEQMLLPRYYVPLTLKGKLAIKLGLHKPLGSRVPPSVMARYRDLRGRWYNRKLKAAAESS